MLWLLPVLSGVFGAASLIMFIWAILIADSESGMRLAAAMQEVKPSAIAQPPGSEPWETADRASGISRMIAHLPWVDRLQVQLLRAGWLVKPSEFIAFSTLGALLLASLFMLVTGSSWMGLPGLLIAFCIVWLALKSRQASRNRALSAQLPDVLDMLCSSLRAGFSVGQAMNRVQGQMPPPIATEFRNALEEMRLGRSLADALETMVARTSNYDLALVVSAVQTQLEIGGNIAEVLSNIASMIRERVKLKGEIAVASAEGRLSATVLLAMPVGMALVIRIMNGSYLDPLVSTAEGRLMLATGAALMVLGALILNKLTAIEV
ncbi:MAG: type II secretion system F family protein [Armatimonadia bacterium]